MDGFRNFYLLGDVLVCNGNVVPIQGVEGDVEDVMFWGGVYVF